MGKARKPLESYGLTPAWACDYCGHTVPDQKRPAPGVCTACGKFSGFVFVL
jgi:rubrerythrin